jgi:hypothetical protein
MQGKAAYIRPRVVELFPGACTLDCPFSAILTTVGNTGFHSKIEKFSPQKDYLEHLGKGHTPPKNECASVFLPSNYTSRKKWF